MNSRTPWVPPNQLLTVFLLVAWLALVVYAFASGDALAWVLAAIFVFAALIPAVVLYIVSRRARGGR